MLRRPCFWGKRLGLLPKVVFSAAASWEKLGLSVMLSVKGSVSSTPSLGTGKMQRRKAFGCRLRSLVFTLPMLVTTEAMLDCCSEITSQAFGSHFGACFGEIRSRNYQPIVRFMLANVACDSELWGLGGSPC